MKNIFTYYTCILPPIVIILWLNRSELITPKLFIGLFLFYSFIYRTYIDGKRLADKKLINKKDIWKMVIPGSRLQYFRELYLD